MNLLKKNLESRQKALFSIKKEAYNKVNQPDILFASALKMTGYLRR